MATRDSKAITIPMFIATLTLILVGGSVQGLQEKYMEFDKQLSLINKPPLKSFQTHHGDIIDCIDIYKQLAFNHPLLKNHTIQMKPQTIPKEKRSRKASNTLYKSSNYMPKNIKCPVGSVPIKRATRKDLLMAESVKSMGLNHQTRSNQHSNMVDPKGHYFAVLQYRNQVYGASSRINIWQPNILDDQFSIGTTWVVTGPKEDTNSIQAGWAVHTLLSPNEAVLYTYWTGDGYQRTGCYNVLCPGFVQVSTEVVLGQVLTPSTYNGVQSDMQISIYQDRPTENWWLMYEGKQVGYWPKEIIPRLVDGATVVSWGGQVYSPVGRPTPAMGSGGLPDQGFGKSAFIMRIKVDKDYNHPQFIDPQKDDLSILTTQPKCYNSQFGYQAAAAWGYYSFFGGPENCLF
ncbi:protein neprosin-like [Humulus lupulus]|uniref:protein neprosin-like n=1 Tax=Humulus lupulus TaxID=3486 RepID=UPI002B41255C|nr:protein neprosin-like [Humulus lupulus]